MRKSSSSVPPSLSLRWPSSTPIVCSRYNSKYLTSGLRCIFYDVYWSAISLPRVGTLVLDGARGDSARKTVRLAQHTGPFWSSQHGIMRRRCSFLFQYLNWSLNDTALWGCGKKRRRNVMIPIGPWNEDWRGRVVNAYASNAQVGFRRQHGEGETLKTCGGVRSMWRVIMDLKGS